MVWFLLPKFFSCYRRVDIRFLSLTIWIEKQISVEVNGKEIFFWFSHSIYLFISDFPAIFSLIQSSVLLQRNLATKSIVTCKTTDCNNSGYDAMLGRISHLVVVNWPKFSGQSDLSLCDWQTYFLWTIF